MASRMTISWTTREDNELEFAFESNGIRGTIEANTDGMPELGTMWIALDTRMADMGTFDSLEEALIGIDEYTAKLTS